MDGISDGRYIHEHLYCHVCMETDKQRTALWVGVGMGVQTRRIGTVLLMTDRSNVVMILEAGFNVSSFCIRHERERQDVGIISSWLEYLYLT